MPFLLLYTKTVRREYLLHISDSRDVHGFYSSGRPPQTCHDSYINSILYWLNDLSKTNHNCHCQCSQFWNCWSRSRIGLVSLTERNCWVIYLNMRQYLWALRTYTWNIHSGVLCCWLLWSFSNGKRAVERWLVPAILFFKIVRERAMEIRLFAQGESEKLLFAFWEVYPDSG